MGKHDTVPEGTINEALERHYQKRIEELEATIEDLKHDLNDALVQGEKLKFRVKLKDIEIESLVKSLAGGEM